MSRGLPVMRKRFPGAFEEPKLQLGHTKSGHDPVPRAASSSVLNNPENSACWHSRYAVHSAYSECCEGVQHLHVHSVLLVQKAQCNIRRYIFHHVVIQALPKLT